MLFILRFIHAYIFTNIGRDMIQSLFISGVSVTIGVTLFSLGIIGDPHVQKSYSRRTTALTSEKTEISRAIICLINLYFEMRYGSIKLCHLSCHHDEIIQKRILHPGSFRNYEEQTNRKPWAMWDRMLLKTV